MEKYLVKIGFDHGDAESGPLTRCCEELIDAVSKEDAERKINNKYGYGRYESFCGCSAKLATTEEIKRITDDLKEQEGMYQSAIELGVLDPYEDVEQDELDTRIDRLMELADNPRLEGFNKWWITNKDQEVLNGTKNLKSDEDIISWMIMYKKIQDYEAEMNMIVELKYAFDKLNANLKKLASDYHKGDINLCRYYTLYHDEVDEYLKLESEYYDGE